LYFTPGWWYKNVSQTGLYFELCLYAKIPKGAKLMPTKKFNGLSKKGDFQEALTRAIDKALSSTGGADFIVKWTFLSAKGEKGGLLPRNSLTVTIEATW
jgi:hypothetical protein